MAFVKHHARRGIRDRQRAQQLQQAEAVAEHRPVHHDRHRRVDERQGADGAVGIF